MGRKKKSKKNSKNSKNVSNNDMILKKIEELEKKKETIEKEIIELSNELKEEIKKYVNQKYLKDKFSLILKEINNKSYLYYRIYVDKEMKEKERLNFSQKDLCIGSIENEQIRQLYLKYAKIKQLKEEIKHINYTINVLQSLT